MLENLPLTGLVSFVGIILVRVFFITSSDSRGERGQYAYFSLTKLCILPPIPVSM